MKTSTNSSSVTTRRIAISETRLGLKRVPTAAGARTTYDELINRDKASLDIFWLRDESLEESDNLPDPDVLAQEIVEDLEAALEQFREIAADLGAEHANPKET